MRFLQFILFVFCFNITQSQVITDVKTGLRQKSENLVEEKVDVLDIKYTQTKKIKAVERNRQNTYVFGNEMCNYIKNPVKNKSGILESVSFYLMTRKPCDSSAQYAIKFYTYDNYKKSPRDLIYTKKLNVKLENRYSKLRVDLNSLQIPFPENGICIGIEYVKSDSQDLRGTGYLPGVVFLRSKEESETIFWIKDKKEDGDVWVRLIERNISRGENNDIIFNVVAKYEK